MNSEFVLYLIFKWDRLLLEYVSEYLRGMNNRRIARR